MRKLLYTLLLLMTAVTAVAQEDIWANGVRYQYVGNQSVVVISNYYGSYSGNLVIPSVIKAYKYMDYEGESYDSYHVVGIAENAFRDCTSLTSIVIPGSVKNIGKNAFYGCTGLNHVEIGYGVKSIEASAFSNCSNLSSITLPNSVTTLGWNVFYGCASLTNVTLSKSLCALNGTFSECSSLTCIDIPAGVMVMDGTFKNCANLSTVNLPRSLYYIGANTFDGCAALKSVNLPNSVEYVGDMAFANTGLVAMRIPDGVTHLGENAFYGSTALTSVTTRAVTPPLMANSDCFSSETYGSANLFVPEVSLADYQSANWWSLFGRIASVASLNTPYDFEVNGIYYIITGSNAVSVTYKGNGFRNNSYSGMVSVPSTVQYEGMTYTVTGVGNGAFRNCGGLMAVNLPATVTSIGRKAFYGCSGLYGITIPEAVTSIGDSAFYACTGLTDLTIPANITTIGTDAFAGITVQSLTWNARECWSNGGMATSGIRQLYISDGVTVLPMFLAKNSQITTVDFPSSLVCIGDSAFYSCTGLTSLTIPENVTSIGTNAFYNNRISSLTWNARECWDTGAPDHEQSYFAVSQLTIGDGVEVLPHGFVPQSGISSLIIPASVKKIGACAFYRCNQLTSVEIPDGVEYVGERAFGMCSKVTSLTVGKGLSELGDCAFDGLSNLTTLTWNALHCPYAGHMFSNEKLTQVTIGEGVDYIPPYFAYYSKITSMDMPNTVKSIGHGAFCGCDQLVTLHLSDSLVYIDEWAFEGCTSLLSLFIPRYVETISYNCFYGCGEALESIVVDSENTSYDSRDNCNAIINSYTNRYVLICKNTKVPYGFTRIEDYQFWGVTFLTKMDIPLTVTYIGRYAFAGCTGLTSMDIPNSVTLLREDAFYGCTALEHVSLSKSLTRIENDAFRNCMALTDITIPNGIRSIGSYAFEYCSALKSLSFPGSVISIESDAFWGCSSLQSITFGRGLTNIGSYAFYGCNAMTTVTCLALTPPSVGSYALTSMYGATLRVPEASLEAYRSHNVWKNFLTIEGIPGAGPGDLDGDGVIAINDATSLIDLLLSGGELPIYADVDGDGTVSIADITMLIDMLLSNP